MNTSKHTPLAAMILGFVCALLLSCSDSGKATVNISLNLPKNVSAIRQTPDSLIDRVLRFFSSPAQAQNAPEGVTAVALRISGPGMTAFEKRYPADTLLISLAVESGKDRTFLVKAYDADNRVSWAGSATADLKPGEARILLITMKDTLRMVEDINQNFDIAYPNNTFSSNPMNITPYKNGVCFIADDGTHGNELWIYDGVSAPQMVYDINPSSGTGSMNSQNEILVRNDKIYFVADDGIDGIELWVFDGGALPAILGSNIRKYNINTTISGTGTTYGSSPNNLVIFNNKLYFAASDSVATGEELWCFDGTIAPFMVENINNAENGSSSPQNFIVHNGALYFAATSYNFQTELWRCDSANNVTALPNINVDSDGSNPSNMTLFNNSLYFIADDGLHGYELWRLDSEGDPEFFYDIDSFSTDSSSPSFLTVLNNTIYFSASTGESGGREPWGYDGTNDPSMIYDLVPGGSASSEPMNLKAFNRKLYFTAYNESYDHYLYSYDPGISASASNPQPLVQHYAFSINPLGKLLAYIDNIAAGTGPIYVFNPALPVEEDSVSPNPLQLQTTEYSPATNEMISLGNRLYFSANDGIHGQELWVYEYYE